MLSFLRQLAERTDSSSSSTFLSSTGLNASSGLASSEMRSRGSSKLMKTWSWSCRMRAAYATALSGHDFAGPCRAKGKPLWALRMHTQRDLLHVEHDVGNVLAHTLNRRKFMQHPLDLDRGDGRALQRGQKHTPERVAERQTKAALQRLSDDRGGPAGVMAAIHFQLLRFD